MILKYCYYEHRFPTGRGHNLFIWIMASMHAEFLEVDAYANNTN